MMRNYRTTFVRSRGKRPANASKPKEVTRPTNVNAQTTLPRIGNNNDLQKLMAWANPVYSSLAVERQDQLHLLCQSAGRGKITPQEVKMICKRFRKTLAKLNFQRFKDLRAHLTMDEAQMRAYDVVCEEANIHLQNKRWLAALNYLTPHIEALEELLQESKA